MGDILRVNVRSSAGSLANILVRPFDRIRAGTPLMYFPARSKTPAFEDVAVWIETDGHAGAAAGG
jgi:hypothetical protein